jgi:ATP-dependent RNA helicase DHX33
MQVLRGAIKTEADHKADRSKDSLHRWCRDNRLNLRTLQEAIAIREQLRKLVVQDGQPCDTSCGDDTTLVLRSLLWGQHQYTAKITPNGGYKQIMGPTKIKIHPCSTLAGRKVPAFLFDELVSYGKDVVVS